jgi:hypothetical protein
MKRAHPLSERDFEILEELRFTNRESRCPMEWARPLDIGGGSNSDHSPRLSKLERYGMVESRQRSAHMTRGSKQYRITDAGVAAIKMHMGVK